MGGEDVFVVNFNFFFSSCLLILWFYDVNFWGFLKVEVEMGSTNGELLPCQRALSGVKYLRFRSSPSPGTPL